MPITIPLAPISGASTGASHISTVATQIGTDLPPTKVVTAIGESAKSNSGMASGDNNDQGRASLEQQAAALTRRPDKATPSSVVEAQVAAGIDPCYAVDKPPLAIHSPFDDVVPPDPLPTAPVLKRASAAEM